MGEPAGPDSRPPNTPSPIVACKPPARAVRWTGSNQADVEALTGRCTAPSLMSATTILVDAWGTPQPCPKDWWVVVDPAGVIAVLSTEQFLSRYKIDRSRRAAAVTTREAA